MKKVIIVGGGTAGITAAAQLVRRDRTLDIVLFEPSEHHYYQPLYTLVGAGADRKEKTQRRTADLIPPGVKWIKGSVASFEPDNNAIVTDGGERHSYDILIVAMGIQMDWDKIKGLPETLGRNQVCSVYGYQASEDTFATLKRFTGGTAVFTAGSTPVKCGGASQKIMYLSDAYFRRTGVRDRTKIIFASAGTTIFGVPGFKEALQKVVDDRGIDARFHHELIAVDGPGKKATFQVRLFQNGEQVGTEERVLEFDMLHVVPPQSAPDVIKTSPLAIPSGKLAGWLDVDHHTLQHVRFKNVFGLGDVCGLPTAKTGAAVRKQVPVVVAHIMDALANKRSGTVERYNGYSACPILTDDRHVLMAEFEYGNKPSPSFFFDTTKPRWSMYLLKHYFLPWFYWNRMLKGKG